MAVLKQYQGILALFFNIKLYVLRSSWWINIKFAMPFTALSIPISICLGRVDVGPERGGGGGGVPLVCGCFVLCSGLHVLVQQSVTVFG